jgi:hypothetical protein
MTEEQKEIIRGFKKYIDQVNRTATLSMDGNDYASLQDVHIKTGRGHIPSCKTCIINALRQLYNEANN